jgi:hypothetical protein
MIIIHPIHYYRGIKIWLESTFNEDEVRVISNPDRMLQLYFKDETNETFFNLKFGNVRTYDFFVKNPCSDLFDL